jgi:nucleotidyltransferase substrate binding protein (TIGR01987 family)
MALEPSSFERWQYRLENFERAFLLLREAMETLQKRELSALEKEGVIQRFEYCWELAWKTMKDYMESQGVILDTITPKTTMRAALQSKIISDGEA